MQLRNISLGECVNPNVPELALLVEGSDMLKVARKAVQALGDDNIDVAAPDSRQQQLKAWSQRRRARGGVIGVIAGESPALPRDALAANTLLVLN